MHHCIIVITVADRWCLAPEFGISKILWILSIENCYICDFREGNDSFWIWPFLKGKFSCNFEWELENNTSNLRRGNWITSTDSCPCFIGEVPAFLAQLPRCVWTSRLLALARIYYLARLREQSSAILHLLHSRFINFMKQMHRKQIEDNVSSVFINGSKIHNLLSLKICHFFWKKNVWSVKYLCFVWWMKKKIDSCLMYDHMARLS